MARKPKKSDSDITEPVENEAEETEPTKQEPSLLELIPYLTHRPSCASVRKTKANGQPFECDCGLEALKKKYS